MLHFVDSRSIQMSTHNVDKGSRVFMSCGVIKVIAALKSMIDCVLLRRTGNGVNNCMANCTRLAVNCRVALDLAMEKFYIATPPICQEAYADLAPAKLAS